ncbi:MAG: hypothetical protein MK066_11270 [Crocinitomicaceae bacterium]|nr:hypothetical protein [Crocinitomicaceae bacterium]
MNVRYLFFILLVILFSSCNRNQNHVNRLDGKWNVTSTELVGYGKMDPDIIYEFEECKLKKDDFCEVTVHNFDLDQVESGLFSITDSGQKMQLFSSNTLGSILVEYDVEKFRLGKLVLTRDDASFGEYCRIEMKCIRN